MCQNKRLIDFDTLMVMCNCYENDRDLKDKNCINRSHPDAPPLDSSPYMFIVGECSEEKCPIWNELEYIPKPWTKEQIEQIEKDTAEIGEILKEAE